MQNVAIIGSAALPIGRWQTKANDAEQVLEHEVIARLVVAAMADAQADKKDVSAILFAQPRPYTLQKYFATFIANYLRLQCNGIVAELMGNGMTAALAFDAAADQIRLGRARVALALGVNFETATPAIEHMMSSMRTTGDVDFHVPFGFTPISWYAMDAARYMHEYGVTRAELASVAVKNRGHAVLNPIAQFRKPITLEEVLAQKPIVEPLGLFEVPPRSDGAVCLVLASEDVAKSIGQPYSLIRGRGFFHEGAHQISEVPNDMISLTAAKVAGQRAYEDAKITSRQIDFAEVYAPCTIIEVLVSEALGLVPKGGGARAAVAGETRLGGRIPICTSGGLQSRGHPAYVTPLYSFHEAFEQLRGRAGERQVENARLGLVSAELGNYNAALVHVLEAQS